MFFLDVFLDTVTGLKCTTANVTCPSTGEEITFNSCGSMTLFHVLIKGLQTVIFTEADRASVLGIVIALGQIFSLVLQKRYSTGMDTDLERILELYKAMTYLL